MGQDLFFQATNSFMLPLNFSYFTNCIMPLLYTTDITPKLSIY